MLKPSKWRMQKTWKKGMSNVWLFFGSHNFSMLQRRKIMKRQGRFFLSQVLSSRNRFCCCAPHLPALLASRPVYHQPEKQHETFFYTVVSVVSLCFLLSCWHPDRWCGRSNSCERFESNFQPGNKNSQNTFSLKNAAAGQAMAEIAPCVP